MKTDKFKNITSTDYCKLFIFSKETGGGTGVVLNQLAQITNRKFKLRFYFYKKDPLSTFKHSHLFVNKYYPENDKFGLKKAIIFIDNLLKTHSLINKGKPHIFLSGDFYSFILLSLLKPLTNNTPFIASHHINLIGYIKDKPNELYQNTLFYLAKILFRLPDKHIFVSRGLCHAMNKKFSITKEKSVVINNAVNLSLIEKKARAEIPNNLKKLVAIRRPKIITVGRLAKQKDYPTLLKAFSLVLKQKRDARLFIISDGPLRNQLIKLAKRLKVDNYVDFLGWIDNFFPIIKLADVFVFSSNYEGFGITILEAMAVKIPVVSTDTPHGPSEILESGKFGILVPKNNPEKLAKAIERVLNNNTLRNKYAKKGYERVKDFDIKDMLSKYETLFLKLIK